MNPHTSGTTVTIVTPSYNQGHFIRATIESVLSQDYPCVEYIVMDGGSTDQTASVVKDYASRLTFVSEADRGQSHAINKGFRRGQGTILAWLNSDDVYLPGAISTAMRAFSTRPASGMVYGEGYVIDRDGEVQGRFPHSRPFDLWRLVHLSDYILQQSAFYCRAALDDVGYVDEELRYGLDWDLFIRIGMKYEVSYIPEYLGCIREYAETKSSQGGFVRARELHALLRKHTGQRLPPGSIVYTGETCVRLWRSWLERSTLPGMGPLVRAGSFVLQLVAGQVIGQTLQHAQRLYDDGWAGHPLRFMLPAGAGSLALVGHIPSWARRLHGQQLAIYANGRLLGRYAAPIGDFELCVPVPPELEGAPLHLEVAASRSFRPARLTGDRRRLAFLLSEIRWH